MSKEETQVREFAVDRLMDMLPFGVAAGIMLIGELVSSKIDRQQVNVAFEWIGRVYNSELRRGPRTLTPNQLFESIRTHINQNNITTYSATEFGGGNYPTRYIDQQKRLIIIDHQPDHSQYLTKEDVAKPTAHRFAIRSTSLNIMIYKEGDWSMTNLDPLSTDYIQGDQIIPKENTDTKPIETFHFEIQNAPGLSLPIAEYQGSPLGNWDEGIKHALNELSIQIS